MEIDEACMLMVMAAAAGDAKAYKAATYMIAARDEEACKAMYVAGMISDCRDKKGRSTVKAAPAVTSRSTTSTKNTNYGYSKCELEANNTVKIKYKFGVDKDVAKKNCLLALGF
jgi:hypothetical protein